MTPPVPTKVHGFPVIAHYHTPRAPATRAGYVILVQRQGDYLHPFVTGWLGLDDDQKVFDCDWTWGHYFKTEGEARQDYTHRCKRGY